jgi:hypothetical protein
LERGGATEASFLLLRALCLPEFLEERQAVCAVAAAELARQQRQMDVVEKAVEVVADSSFDDLKFTPEQVFSVARKEKAARVFPSGIRSGPDYSDLLESTLCDCLKCRRARGESAGPFDDLADDKDDSFLDEIIDETGIPPDMPPEIARILFDETKKAVQRGESLDSFLNRTFGPDMGFGGKRKKGRRR